MRYKITAPLKGFTGQSVGVAFQSGVAEVEDTSDAGRSAIAYFQRAGYRVDEISDGESAEVLAPVDGDKPYDPAGHKADEVLAYLDGASYQEAVRVLDVEAAADGKARVTITGKRDEILAAKTPAPADDQKGPQA
ncbi:hypothetical protein V2S66_03250 [Streptomyces sp. V4-01]|uniref:Uncharacterized protein n=1 Tax=Actinacidiphila polyblastidii TaxID=3110430 RepID=A0ABU7P5B3_9ACTN|nr:hypothetical protein [Streptomyces sp. V4-01]